MSVAALDPGRAVRVLLVDNYDSFTWNLVQIFEELGAAVQVVANDRISPEEVVDGSFRALVISPGPGRPEAAGASEDLIRAAEGRMPVLGVCLGHQAIARVHGARIVRAPSPVHGKTSAVRHDGRTIFLGLPIPFQATRYHSLAVDPSAIPADLEVSAWSEDGVVMGLRARSSPTEGVQFHPESVKTPEGRRLVENFLSMAREARP